jgi:hypothetical protein
MKTLSMKEKMIVDVNVILLVEKKKKKKKKSELATSDHKDIIKVLVA